MNFAAAKLSADQASMIVCISNENYLAQQTAFHAVRMTADAVK